jgi:hypothetical protein
VKELCRKHGFSDGSYYLWRSKFGGMSVSDAKRLKELETENTRLKKLLADSLQRRYRDVEPDRQLHISQFQRRNALHDQSNRRLCLHELLLKAVR